MLKKFFTGLGQFGPGWPGGRPAGLKKEEGRVNRMRSFLSLGTRGL